MPFVREASIMYLLLDFIGVIVCVVVNLPHGQVQTIEPSFDVPVVNVTAIAGKTAVLPCSVSLLGDHVVAWMAPGGKLMTLETRRIIADQRITVERPYTKDWNLYIHGVKHEDSGRYMCQINTDPVKIKYVQLFVQEAPKILDQGTTTHVTVREGATVNVTCNVSGVPPPRVSWYRRSSYNKHLAKEKIGNDGETLIIHNISRFCDDIYQCVAFNTIEPSASREIRVEVQFPPEIVLPNRRISQYQGKETIMECRISANPQAYSAWTRNGKTISASDPGVTTPKYRTEIYEEMQYTITISLRILLIDEEDFGEYRCEAENKLGRDREEMILSELKLPTTQPTTNQFIHTTSRWRNRGDIFNKSWTTAPRVYPNQKDFRGPNEQPSFHREPKYENLEPGNLAITCTYSVILSASCLLCINILLGLT